MKFSNRVFLFLCIITTSVQLNANDASAPESAVIMDDTVQVDQRKVIITAVAQQLEYLASKLQEAMQGINKGVVTVANKAELRKTISLTCHLIAQIQNLLLSNLNDDGLAFAIAVTKDLTIHINSALDKGFAELPLFDIQSTIDRTSTRGKAPSLDTLQAALDENKALQNSFTNKISNLGLSLGNKVYRKFNKFVLEPFDKNNVAYWATRAAAVGSIPLGIWFESESESPKWLRDFMGYPWNPVSKKSPEGGESKAFIEAFQQDSDKPLKALGHLEKYLRSFNAGHWALFAASLPYTLPIAKDVYNKTSLHIKKHVMRLHNTLMGGVYKMRTVKLTGELGGLEPKLTLNELIGLSHVKEEFSRIIDYLEAPERFAAAGLDIPKGYLLTGKTRTGKTYSFEAMLGSIKEMLKRNGRGEKEIKWAIVTPEDLQFMSLPDIANWAERNAPCLIFFDEIDMLGLQRSRDSKLLSQFLTAMSGVMNGDPQKPVFWFAATNKDENLDDALKQHGRFGKELHFEYPSLAERLEFIHRELEKMGTDTQSFDILLLGHLTNGHSFQSINTMLHTARFAALRTGQPLNQLHIHEALNNTLRHMIPTNYDTLAQEERKILAVHWAGHALARLLLPVNKKLAEVTIRPLLLKPEEAQVWEKAGNKQKIMYGSVFTYTNGDSRNITTQQEAIDLCKIELAGKAAEQVLLSTTSNCHHDAQAGLYAARTIALEGIDFAQLPPESQHKYTSEALKLKDTYYQQVVTLLQSNKEKLSLLAFVLEKFGSLTEQDIEFLFTQKGKEFFLSKIEEIEKHNAEQMAELQKTVDKQNKTEELSQEPIPAVIA